MVPTNTDLTRLVWFKSTHVDLYDPIRRSAHYVIAVKRIVILAVAAEPVRRLATGVPLYKVVRKWYATPLNWRTTFCVVIEV